MCQVPSAVPGARCLEGGVAIVTGGRLPDALVSRLSVNRAAMEGTAVPICTIDADGFPHPAMLSYGELAADAPDTIRAAVYGSSTTARNLRTRQKLTLLFVDAGITCYVKARVAGDDTPHPSVTGVVVFPCAVESVLIDRVDTSREPAAVIETGITFRRPSPGTTL
jgi:hypothetical protein